MNLHKAKITTDLVPRTTKPAGKEIGAISKSLTIPVEVTIPEFSELMGKGYTFSPAIFKNNIRKNANWQEQSVFALDFDSGVTPETILKRFKSHSITPNVFYKSFSDEPSHRKFRVVLFLDKVVTCEKERDFMQRGLMNLIGDVDVACKDAARLYFGGKKSVVHNNSPISFDSLFDVIQINTMASDNGKTRKLLKSVSKPQSLLYSIETAVFSQKDVVRDFDFNLLQKEVKLFDDFQNGAWLTHPQIFGLATAMHWIEGGIKLMKETMQKHNASGKTSYTQNNFASLSYARYQKYQPQRLDSYSPYKQDHEHFNPITAVKEQRGFVEILHQREKMSLQEAETAFKDYFHSALKAEDTNIYIIKVPTGIGKTRALETTTATIALPTNSLKEEVYERVLVAKTMTPTLPKVNDLDFTKKLEYLYKVGLPDVALKFINSTIKRDKWKFADSEIKALKDYLKDLKKSYASKKAVITTHTRAVFSEFAHKTLIFDEDPLSSLLKIASFSIADFMKLEKGLWQDNLEYKAVTDYLRDLPVGILTKTPTFNLDMEKLARDIEINNTIEDDLLSFINSDYLVRDARDSNKITYIASQALPEDKKVIILSATVPVEIYKSLYGDRVKVIDITDVEHKGNIVQNTKRSFSRESLRMTLERIEEIIDTQLPTITFAEFVGKIQNAVQSMYFGNVSGYDELKGQNINILGTPHLNTAVYLLISAVVGLNLKPKDMVMSFQTIEWNGFKFKFNCYAHPGLRAIQLSLIENELLQAIGRARALREECSVFVYSNLPLRVSTKLTRG